MTQIPPPSSLQVAQSGETDVVVRRDFAHPPARVWRALTEPALIRQWLGGASPMTRCEIDARPGGSFLYEWPDFTFSGPILTAEASHRMTHEERFSGDPAYRVHITTDLAPQGSGTRMTMVMRYPDAASRAAAIQMGMTDGFDQVYERLDALPFTD